MSCLDRYGGSHIGNCTVHGAQPRSMAGMRRVSDQSMPTYSTVSAGSACPVSHARLGRCLRIAEQGATRELPRIHCPTPLSEFVVVRRRPILR